MSSSTVEDLAFVAWMESLPGHAEYAARMGDEAYTAWASDCRENGEDDSEEAYTAYLEGFFPDD